MLGIPAGIWGTCRAATPRTLRVSFKKRDISGTLNSKPKTLNCWMEWILFSLEEVDVKDTSMG